MAIKICFIDFFWTKGSCRTELYDIVCVYIFVQNGGWFLWIWGTMAGLSGLRVRPTPQHMSTVVTNLANLVKAHNWLCPDFVVGQSTVKLASRFIVNGKPALAYINYISNSITKLPMYTFILGKNKLCMHISTHHIYPISKIVKVLSASVFRFLSCCRFIFSFS
jgi:hypothetical protein